MVQGLFSLIFTAEKRNSLVQAPIIINIDIIVLLCTNHKSSQTEVYSFIIKGLTTLLYVLQAIEEYQPQHHVKHNTTKTSDYNALNN